jgi:wyosine [tRNA(Phe)-imidazoG37] synthetase (radical SAM superfamily)
MAHQLTTKNHDRGSAGLTYVYPVLSRRSGGLSIGINLNPNNACNWRCIYCQVPGLVRGAAPDIDLVRFRSELSRLLEDAMEPDFYAHFQIPAAQRAIRDIAISGNGEPTSARVFPEVIGIIRDVAASLGILGTIPLVLITNGSLMKRPAVQRGIAEWADLGGEIWFKVDSATREGLSRVNGVALSPLNLARNLRIAGTLCPTWVQTCLFALDGWAPEESGLQAYLDFLSDRLREELPLRGVLLYGLARPSLQAEAARLTPLNLEWLEAFAARIRALGLPVKVAV